MARRLLRGGRRRLHKFLMLTISLMIWSGVATFVETSVGVYNVTFPYGDEPYTSVRDVSRVDCTQGGVGCARMRV